MQRHSSQTRMTRITQCPDGLESSARLVGKVVLVEATEPHSAVLRAHRYAKEGADIAIAYDQPWPELFTVQRQIEALGNRCVLYEIALDDEWNCGLVVQSTAECLGPIGLIVNGHGHVHVPTVSEPLTASGLLDVVVGPRQTRPPRTDRAA